MKKATGACLLAILLALGTAAASSEPGPGITPDAALKKLTDGNARYAAGTSTYAGISKARRAETAHKGQKPFATILSCSDSRVPPEYIFDQGIGELFIIRVAGNVADTDEIGSMEYGVDHLGTPVLLVLGHTKCGAVTAVVSGAEVHGSIPALVENITPAVDRVKSNKPELKADALISEAIAQNVWLAIEDTLRKSPSIRERAKKGKVKVIGALYDIESGRISIMGSHPAERDLLEIPTPPGKKH